MSLHRSMEASAQGMQLARARLEVASENLAHAHTTRTAEGGPFRRHVLLARSAEGPVEVAEDPSPPRREYDPGHPDADEQGWVAYPNVDIVREMVDAMAAVREFESNATAFNEAKRMVQAALDLGRA